jgi:hypothetical protein
MAPPTWAAHTSSAIGGAGALAISIDVTPLGLSVGDRLVVSASWRAEHTGGVTPTQAGWTELGEVVQSLGPTSAVYERVVAGGDPTTYEFTVTGAASRVTCDAVKVTGADAVDDFAIASGNSTTPTAPAVTAAGDDRLLVRFWSRSHLDTLTGFPPATYTTGFQTPSGGAAAGHVEALAAYKTQGSGAAGTSSVTLGLARGWTGASLLLTPTAGGGGVASNLEETGAMNVLAGTEDLSLERAANVYAGTTGLSLDGALNVANSSTGLSATKAANELAGTTSLELRGALNALVDALP